MTPCDLPFQILPFQTTFLHSSHEVLGPHLKASCQGWSNFSCLICTASSIQLPLTRLSTVCKASPLTWDLWCLDLLSQLGNLLQEMYYRHLYASMQPTLEQRVESWDNYCLLFNIILKSQVNMQVCPALPLPAAFELTKRCSANFVCKGALQNTTDVLCCTCSCQTAGCGTWWTSSSTSSRASSSTGAG